MLLWACAWLGREKPMAVSAGKSSMEMNNADGLVVVNHAQRTGSESSEFVLGNR